MKTNICTKCGKELPATAEYFYRDKHRADGLRPDCKECYLFYKKDRKDNPEKYDHSKDTTKKCNKCGIEKTFEEFHKKRNNVNHICKECVKDKYYANHDQRKRQQRERYDPIKSAEYNKMYKKSHKDEIRDWTKEYFKNKPGLRKIYKQRRNAIKRSLPSTLTKKQWAEIKEHFSGKCCYCNRELPLTIEHFIPITKSGELTRNNIIPACKSCNSSKGNRDALTWFRKQEYYSKAREQKILSFLGYNNGVQQLKLG